MSKYEDQLERALSEASETEEIGRFSLPEPDVRQEGNTTVYENFQDFVQTVDRDENDVLEFLQRDMGTSAHLDEKGRARLVGDFNAGRIMEAVEEFTDKYVICPECGSPDTRLEGDDENLSIKCEACGEKSPVE
ncbi:translation initiation factor IF-2 subunit beta [Halorutilales archaeon Cl-col2-1]